MNDDGAKIINSIDWGTFKQQLVEYVRLELAGEPVDEVYAEIAFQIATSYECLEAYHSELHRQTMSKLVAAQHSSFGEGRIADLLQKVLASDVPRVETTSGSKFYQKLINASANIIDKEVLDSNLGSIRRVVEAIIQSPLQISPQLSGAVRGEILRYATPQIVINLSARKSTGKQRTWRLAGQLRTVEGQLFTDVERITLRLLESAEPNIQQATWTEGGTFIFEKLFAGKYSLSVVMEMEEIAIHEVKVGEDL